MNRRTVNISYETTVTMDTSGDASIADSTLVIKARYQFMRVPACPLYIAVKQVTFTIVAPVLVQWCIFRFTLACNTTSLLVMENVNFIV